MATTRVIIPTDEEVAAVSGVAGFELDIDIFSGHLSDYGRSILRDPSKRNGRGFALPNISGGGSWSDYAENKMLDHFLGKTSYTLVTPLYLALCTVVPEDSKTGSTITQASYTGYARKSIAAADLNAAASGSSSNANKLEFAACTSGSSTIVGWAICDASSAGNMICWSSCTSTVISTTQTPATIGVGGLVVSQD